LKQSGGHAAIYSEEGRGTTVRLYFPRYTGAEEATALNGAPVAEALLPRGAADEVVLVVEDEAAMRATSVEALLELGYSVRQAKDGAEALRVLAEHSDVALLFTDVVLPGMTGRELADEAERRHPGLKILYTTGYTRNAIVHGGRLDPGVELLSKPFTTDQLARKVRSVLDD
jgi:CheY-like chemotaxis protein